MDLRPKAGLFGALLLGAALASACSSASSDREDPPEPGTELLGGATTVFDVSQNAFSFPARNLDKGPASHI